MSSATPANTGGLAALKAFWKDDLLSGFMVFLLALPLSLGIAKASGFPAAMGVLTAIVGGLFTTFFRVSALTIKGPAAGLITICSGAVLEFGGGDQGWKVAAAAIVFAALIQMVFALLKFGALSDFFPHSAVHGMLAAIGIIIIAKQVPVLLGDDPSIYKGEGPIQMLLDIPRFITQAHWHIAIVGLIALAIMFGLPALGIKALKKVPAPMVVLLITVPLSVFWHFRETEPAYSLVSIGDFWGSLGLNIDLSMIAAPAFWKYVFMFLFVNSLESLLTVKAVDNLDPWKRESSYNGDLFGLGAGNLASGLLGGLPMISEVVRSTANIGFGGRSKWANFFHGAFLLLAMLLMIPLIEMIPNAALAAMLIYAGYRLAAPSQFVHALHLGKEQLLIFLTTIVVTLAEDLLLGIAAGIVVKIIFHVYHGASLGSLFRARYEIHEQDGILTIKVLGAAAFSNLIGYKALLGSLSASGPVRIDLGEARLVDHSFLAFVSHFVREANAKGKDISITGMEDHVSFSDHPLATRLLLKRNHFQAAAAEH